MQGFSNIIFPHKPLFEGDPAESSYMRQQISAIVFHTIVALAVTFFLDINNNREKVRVFSWTSTTTLKSSVYSLDLNNNREKVRVFSWTSTTTGKRSLFFLDLNNDREQVRVFSWTSTTTGKRSVVFLDLNSYRVEVGTLLGPQQL